MKDLACSFQMTCLFSLQPLWFWKYTLLKSCFNILLKRAIFFRWYSFKTIKATDNLSTPFESWKQDLSFDRCNFSVSLLVLEISAKTWTKSDPRFGPDRLLLSVLLSPRKIKLSATFELISQEVVKIQNIYTHQMKDLAFSFKMACLTFL